MAKTYESFVPKIRDFIEKQKMFFVATAPTTNTIGTATSAYLIQRLMIQ